jgi:phage repressor protein C with HTH and peptisase S24 domain
MRAAAAFGCSDGALGMLTHAQIWACVDGLAARHSMTASGLARKAGLDPTTFNRSKRIARDGRQRWPSTESIAKVLEATGASLTEFLELLAEPAATPAGQTLPMIPLAETGLDAFFDPVGHPRGSWDAISFPHIDDANGFALEVTGDVLAPFYRDGTVLIISPQAPMRRGDRIVAQIASGTLMIGELKRRTAKTVELKAFRGGEEHVLTPEAITWIARIVWASQ